MKIICTTQEAAAQVLYLLLSDRLNPIRDFEIRPLISTTPPIIYTLLTIVPRTHQAKIRAIADTTIVE